MGEYQPVETRLILIKTHSVSNYKDELRACQAASYARIQVLLDRRMAMEIKPLVIGLGTERRLVLHFVELDLREQRVLVSLTVKDHWLRVEDFRCWFARTTLETFAEQLEPWLRVRTTDAALISDFDYEEINNFSLKLQVLGGRGDIRVVYALDATEYELLVANGEFDFNLDFLWQFVTDVQQHAATLAQIWNDPAIRAAYPHVYPLSEPID